MPRPRKSTIERRVMLAVYVPKKVLKRLVDLAVKDRRSTSTQALILIEQGLEKIDS